MLDIIGQYEGPKGQKRKSVTATRMFSNSGLSRKGSDIVSHRGHGSLRGRHRVAGRPMMASGTGCLRTGHLVDRDHGRSDRLKDGITRRDGPKLVAESGPVSTPGDTPEPNSVGLEHAPRLSLDVAANVDHPPARRYMPPARQGR